MHEPSQAVCRRLGMTHLGRMRRWYDMELEVYRLGSVAYTSVTYPGA